MTNILFIYQRKMATTEGIHEIFTSQEAIRHGLHSRFITTRNVNGKLLSWADVIVFVRNHDLFAQWILRKAKRKGIFIIQFFDDDVLNLPKLEVNRVQFLPWRRKAIKKGFRNTDLILSSNPLLAKKYAKMIPSGRYAVMDTVIDPKLLVPLEQREKKYNKNKVKIVFAAGANHEEMFNHLIAPVLPNLIEKYGDLLSFTFFGVHPDMSSYEGIIDIDYIGAMPLNQYRKSIQDGGFDLGLSPLEANEFTQYKYFNKFIEYTIAGITGVYSKVLPYTLAVVDRENGFFAENTPDGWLQTLSLAIEDTDLRKNCYKNAYNYLLSHMGADSILEKLKNDIPELKRTHTDKGAIFVVFIRTKFLILRFIEYMYLVGEYIRLTGISGTVKKIRNYLMDQKNAKKEKLGE